MSSLYEFEKLKDGAGYQFVTLAGDIYIAYFTEFILLDRSGRDISVVSFGFNCKRADEDERQHYDSKVKQTIIYIIKEFFEEQGENAILYLCINSDGKARNRQIIFNTWYNEFNEDFEKHNSSEAHGKLGFYGQFFLNGTIPINKN